MSGMMSPPTSTDGFSLNTTTSASELELLSTALPSSSIRRRSAIVLAPRSREARSSRSRPTLSLSTLAPAACRAVSPLSGTPLDTSPSAPERASTLPPSLAAWPQRPSSSSWREDPAFPPRRRSRPLTSRTTTAPMAPLMPSLTSSRRFSTPTTELARPSLSYAKVNTSSRSPSTPTFTRRFRATTPSMTSSSSGRPLDASSRDTPSLSLTRSSPTLWRASRGSKYDCVLKRNHHV
mmetsp:Transcript_4208/g.8493  ORF Transcript_4208/g.8493 Transcript_4208/m.8493 type:complete len:236 (-) Transcript_4208:41-748(-)